MDITDEAGNPVKRRMPKFRAEEKYGDFQWATVYYLPLYCLVRLECAGAVDEADFVRELTTTEDWSTLYNGYPELREKWADQPRGLNG